MTAEKIALVTDSTCDASDEELAALGVECVHLVVHRADGTAFPLDNTEENILDFYDYLDDCDELPTTSQPTPVEFADMYSKLALEGYTHVLSVHISSRMSGTSNTARMAAQSAPIDVEVVDSRANTVSLYLMVERLAKLRDSGLNFKQLVAAAHDLVGKVSVCFMLDSLKNLVKGGRVGKAVGLGASVLRVKPLLTVDSEGEVGMIGMAKNMKRAVPKLVDVARELTDKFGELEICFVHVRQSEGLEMLKQAFAESGIRFKDVGTRMTGPVITTHVGTGCVGFAYIPVEA